MSKLKIEYRQKCDYCGMVEIEQDQVLSNRRHVRKTIYFGMENFTILGNLTICKTHKFEILVEGLPFNLQ